MFRIWLRSKKVIEINVEHDLQRLRSLVAERASEIGLQNLAPEDAIKMIEAHLLSLARKRYPTFDLSEDGILRKENRLRNELAQVEEKITALESQVILRPHFSHQEES